MATTKSRSPSSRGRATGSRTARSRASRTPSASSAKRDDGLAARTGRTIRDRPYASAAIAAGAASHRRRHRRPVRVQAQQRQELVGIRRGFVGPAPRSRSSNATAKVKDANAKP